MAQSRISVPHQNFATVHVVKIKKLKASHIIIHNKSCTIFHNTSVHKAVKGNAPVCTFDICIPWWTNYENASLKTIIHLNTWTWQCMGYALVYTPTGSMNMDESDLRQAPKALYYMKNPGWMWSMSKHRCQTSPSERDCICTCMN